MLNIAYRDEDRRAVITWQAADEDAPWLSTLKRLLFACSDEASQQGGYQISIPWWSFSAMRPQLYELFQGFGLSTEKDISVEEKARDFLRKSTRNAQSYTLATQAHELDADALKAKLGEIGFSRTLTPEQIRNVRKIGPLPAAATFSVPGAGKTTEALAFFFVRATAGDRLLVVAPKNAFAAWGEQLAICMSDFGAQFVRLRGGQDKIARLLQDDPQFMLITYQQLPRVKELVAGHLAQYRTFVFLDESHRIKGGIGRLTPQAVLSLSHLPVGKLIMSGTPMPQSVEDLLPQFAFLFPEIPAVADNVVELFRPVYVRTNKKELGLPEPERIIKKLPLAPVQNELYKLMKHEVAREAATALSIRSKQAFRSLGRSVARLLQFVSNPSLLARNIEFAHPDLMRAVLAEGDGPKIRYVLRRARELANEGQKVLIWSSFVQNVEYLAMRLADLGAVYIHGGVDAGDEDDDETREGKIKAFHDNEQTMVLVANPAAASEGVSLHTICHHAIYLDRTFNAAHYLQSEDRIHRLGLPPDQKTTIEIVECTGTVDETVRERLHQKVDAMAVALEDSSLRIDQLISLEPTAEDDPEDYTVGLKQEDIEALLRDLTKDD